MKPFIQAQRELLQRADKALELMERKLKLSKETNFVFPTTSQKLELQAKKHLAEYEQAKAELQASWESEEKVLPDQTNMHISETFDWHPHESVY